MKRQMSKHQEIIQTLKFRQIQYFGCVMICYKFVIGLFGVNYGKRNAGKILTWLKKLGSRCDAMSWFRTAMSKVYVFIMVVVGFLGSLGVF